MEKSPFTREHRVLVALLREVRLRAELSQVEIAERLKITQSVVSKWERGDRRIDLIQLRAWCRAVGMKLPDFVGEFEKQLARPVKGK